MEILLIILLIIIIFMIFKNNKETFSQDYYPHEYNSNQIPCNKK